MITFKQLGLSEEVLKVLSELGFEKPTPIQEKTIPHLLTSDQDLVALAQTGTGKTAAFGLPAIQLTDVEDRSTQTLILCPTRELCMQIAADLTVFAKFVPGFVIAAVYGGSSMENQVKTLNKGAHIVVGTPGRTRDLIKRKRLKPGKIARLVLDEADEMLTMGFKEELDAILAETPEKKQTLLFSATMSNEVRSIAKKYMHNTIEIAASKMNAGADNVRHLYYMVQAKDRYEVLKRIADINPNIYGIVFCRTRRETKEVASNLMQDGYNADALHGDLSQSQRDEVMGKFRVRQLQILVATDVAARGLDVTDLTHIINYNLPDDAEVYTHRSGRTGRAGKSGTSIAIIHTRETRRIKEIEKRSGITFTKELVPSGKDICQKQLYSLIDKIEKVKVDEKQIEPFLPAIYKKLDWLSREELIKHFVSTEFNRFLEYYKNAKDINVSDNQRGEKRERGERSENSGRKGRNRGNFTRLFINVGTKNDLNPTRLIGLINDGLKTRDTEIGKIEIMKKFSFFEIEDGMDTALIKSMKGMTFEGVQLSVEVSQEKPQGAFIPKTKQSKQRTGDFNRRSNNRNNDRNRKRSSGGYKGRK